MKRALLLLAVTLAACSPFVVRAGGGRLVANASADGQTYAFDCDPAGQGGRAINLNANLVRFGCPSVDGAARLSVTIRRSEPAGAQAVLTVVGADGAPVARTEPLVFSQLNWSALPTGASLSGNFTAVGAFSAGGRFDLAAR